MSTCETCIHKGKDRYVDRRGCECNLLHRCKKHGTKHYIYAGGRATGYGCDDYELQPPRGLTSAWKP